MGLISVPALAQVADSPIVFANSDGITTTFVDAVNYNGADTSSSGGDNKWLKVEFHFSVVPAQNVDFLDGVTFKIWIEGLDLQAADAPVPGKGVAVALTASVTYVNLRRAKDAYGVVFVPPATLARFSAGGGSTDFDRKFNIHVEANVGGKPVDVFDKNKEQDPVWYKPLRPVTGMIYLQNQSPFIMTDPDRYPPLKLKSDE